MVDSVTAKIHGLDDLKRVLDELPKQLRRKVVLGALRKAARVPLQAARQVVPVMSSADAAKAPYRTPGLIKRRLMVRASKSSGRAGNVGVFINVKPLKTAAIRGFRRIGGKSSQNPVDPFYWKFVNFGTRKMQKTDFMAKAADALPQALEVFKAQIAPVIQWWNSRK